MTTSNEAALDELVAELNKVEKSTGWDRTQALGRVVIREIFGDAGTYETLPDGERRRSFRSLARHPRLAFSPSTLFNSVVATILLDRFESKGIPAREELSPTHVRCLGNLPVEHQVDLARRAILHGWPTRRLEEEARRTRRRVNGLPRVPLYEKDLRRVERWGRAAVFEAESLEELELACLTLEELDGIAARLASLEIHIGQRLARLRRRVKKLGGRLRKLPQHRRPKRRSGEQNSWAEIIREAASGSSSAA